MPMASRVSLAEAVIWAQVGAQPLHGQTRNAGVTLNLCGQDLRDKHPSFLTCQWLDTVSQRVLTGTKPSFLNGNIPDWCFLRSPPKQSICTQILDFGGNPN